MSEYRLLAKGPMIGLVVALVIAFGFFKLITVKKTLSERLQEDIRQWIYMKHIGDEVADLEAALGDNPLAAGEKARVVTEMADRINIVSMTARGSDAIIVRVEYEYTGQWVT